MGFGKLVREAERMARKNPETPGVISVKLTPFTEKVVAEHVLRFPR